MFNLNNIFNNPEHKKTYVSFFYRSDQLDSDNGFQVL